MLEHSDDNQMRAYEMHKNKGKEIKTILSQFIKLWLSYILSIESKCNEACIRVFLNSHKLNQRYLP